ncbi:hypothetical protein CLCR_09415 [Cladophialophora carrionii]|uniref:DUF6603 domain-containing protein n=1 Tax=Cladophialophora carrionii TaxID=86049 RepID=A0A1C1CWK2_9EURO|nr:hypothetical protein CLCR_09415 [Cladophialophora carrionii]
MSYYQFDSFHVNVGSGDGAIHILSSPLQNGGRKVERAFFIDGGRTTAKAYINLTIARIQENFFCPNPYDDGSFLMFDAFVITHWDGDHYDGVIAFLKDELVHVDNRQDPEAYYIRRAWYGWPTNPNDPKQPHTVIYTPWKWLGGNGFSVVGNNLARENLFGTGYIGTNLLVVRTNFENLLGRNFLAQDQQGGTSLDLNNMKTLPALLQMNPVENPVQGVGENFESWPAMYCIAAEGMPLTRKKLPLGHHTAKNMSSIVFILIWRIRPNPERYIISHYFAGDAPGNLELELKNFMDGWAPISMKLSHHGSASSNPASNFLAWNPTNIVVSAGVQYGHPRWEILFAMDAWFRHEQANNGGKARPFYPCQWPSYLVQNAADAYMHQGFSIAELKNNDPSGFVRFVMKNHEQMRDERIMSGQGLYLDNPVTMVDVRRTLFKDRYGYEAPDAEVKQWVSESIEIMMTNLSPLPRDGQIADEVCVGYKGYMSFFGLYYEEPVYETVPWSDVVAVQVTAIPETEKLGQIAIIGINGLGMLTDRRFGAVDTVAENSEVLLPATCSSALGLANLTGPGTAVAVSPYSFKGDDRPKAIDTSTGNPKWPAKSELGHLDEPRSRHMGQDARRTTTGLQDGKDDYSLEPWIEVRGAEDWSFLSSDSEGETDGDDESELFNRLSLNGRTQKLGVLAEPQLRAPVIYREVPMHITKAAVYLACEKVKFPEGSQGYILLKDQPIYGFTDTLHYRGFGLAEVPDKVHNTPLDPDDEVYHWLGTFCGWDTNQPVPNGFALSMCKVADWPIDPSKKEKQDFAMTVPYIDGQQLQFSTGTGAEYTFSKVEEGDKTDKSVTATSLRNMHISRRSLIFGLEDSAALLKTTLADIAKFIRLDLDRYPLLKFLGSQMKLTLDTKKDFHNALWFRPGLEYETILRLQFRMDMTTLNEWLHTFNANLSVDDVLLVARKRAAWMWKTKQDGASFNSSIACLCRMTISSSLQLTGVFELSQTAVMLTLTLDSSSGTAENKALRGRNGAVSSIIQWLTDKFNITKASELDELLKQAADSNSGALDNDSILPRRVQVVLDVDANGKISGVSAATIDIEVCLTVGRPEAAVLAQMPIVFLFSFGWNKTSGFYLKGKLWTVIPDTPFTPYDRALPGFEEYQLIKPVSPVDPQNQQRTLDLARLLSAKESDVQNFPAGIPNRINRCEIEISQKSIGFKGAVRCSPPEDGGQTTPPLISLDELELEASYTWGTKSPSDDGFNLRLAIAVNLYLGGKLDEKKDLDEQYNAATKLLGEVRYDKGAWSIEASVINLSFSHLINFWDTADRGPILDFLSQINIDFVTVKYEFGNKGKTAGLPSSLQILGQFTIADVAELTLDYSNPGGDRWTLTAGLGPSAKTKDAATVGKLLAGFMGDDVIALFPDAIKSAKIEGADGQKALRVICAKTKGVTIFACLVNVGKVSVWFLQLRQGDAAPKRLLKATVSKVSVEVPALHATLNSPWEDLFFVWVQDTTKREVGDHALPGITQQEYDSLAEVLKTQASIADQELLLFKPREKKQTNSSTFGLCTFDDPLIDKTTVIPAGYHLVVVAKDTTGKAGVVLDYLFKQVVKRTTRVDRLGLAELPPPDPSGSEKGTKAPYQAKLGPLSVSNIGLWFKDGMIGINLDATLLMGPIGLSLLGFSIGVPFSGKHSLDNPPSMSEVQWGLKGLIVALDRPPLTVAGGFMRDTSDPKVPIMYTGGLVVTFKPWSLEAMGAYATVKKTPTPSSQWITTIDMKPFNQRCLSSGHDTDELVEFGDAKEFTFAFIFIKLNGPLFSVGFADVAGLVGGFGMNSDILLPTVEQVVNFPFVKERDNTKQQSVVERMQNLMDGPWFTPAEGRYWAAAGLRVTAFQMIAANLVLVIQFGNGSFLVGLFGVATCDVPSLESPVKFAHVELGIVCTFDSNSGIFKLEAQLSPRSFILAPQCHLTGGMALFAWSKGDYSDPDPNQRVEAGDWVFTIGGYHRAFHPPRAYPRPPRLGISWSLDSSLSITGEAYFALTPKVLMGGGRIHAALSLGALYAYFDAFLDFLMNFEPFFFQLQARIAVGVRFTLDLWLVTIRINAEISASLDFRGPPFGGVVHVDFWVFGFDIKFGSPPSPPPPISLERFWAVVIKSGASGKSLLAAAPIPEVDGHGDINTTASADTAAILLTCETGLLPPLEQEQAKAEHLRSQDEDSGTWYVKGGKFSMLATFQFAVNSARLTEKRTILDQSGKEITEERASDAPIDNKYKAVYAKPMQLASTPLTSAVTISVKAPTPKGLATVHIMETWKDQRWKLGTRISPMPSSIWGKYDRNLDPSVVGGAIDSLLNGKDATVALVTGVTMGPPEPARAGDMINKFNVTRDHVSTVYEPQKPDWPLFIGVLEEQDKAWTPRGRSLKWDEVRDKWRSVGDETTTKAVDLWAKRLRFDRDSVEADQKDERLKGQFKPLRGVAPKRLLCKFDLLIPALPMIAVGGYHN